LVSRRAIENTCQEMDKNKMSHKEYADSAKTILLVEDEEAIGQTILTIIEMETPYQALHVTDGFQALTMLPTLRLHLLILDYSLPGMNGIEVYDRVRAMQEHKHLPVMMMSAVITEHHEEVKKRSLPLLRKPFDVDILIDMIEKLIL
jgi:CheY-like chemotaxis protein